MNRLAAPAAGGTLVWLAAVLACGDGGPVVQADVVVTDSAGQVHVRLGPLETMQAPALTAEPVSRSRVELFRVTAARFLGDGTLAVANSGTSQILVLGPDGAERGRLGGEGAGPGEFRRLTSLLVDSAGSLVAYDAGLGRATTFSPAGALVGTRELAPPNRIVDLLPLAILDGDRILATYSDQRMFAPGERRDTMPLLVYDGSGSVTDTVGLWPGKEWSYVTFSQGAGRAEVGFGRDLASAGRSGRAALGSTDSLDVTVYGRDGRVAMRVRGGGGGGAVEPDEVDRWRSDQAERAPTAPEPIRRALSGVRHRETYPGFGGLLLDDGGRLWIGSYPRPGASERVWVVLEPDGAVAGALRLPATARLLDASGDRLALLRRSELDEEYVEVQRVGPAG